MPVSLSKGDIPNEMLKQPTRTSLCETCSVARRRLMTEVGRMQFHQTGVEYPTLKARPLSQTKHS
eukprot:scaffold233771_cov31-Prasinocladus_malaysianus.AAC.1